jgi:hypothetical protein
MQVEFVSEDGLSLEELERQKEEAAAKALNCRRVTAVVDGMEKTFLVRVRECVCA